VAARRGEGRVLSHTITFVLALVWLSYCFAEVEIAIEGPHGWAANLPTWRLSEHHWANAFLGGKPVTGYHVWVITFVFSILHMPYVFVAPSWALEAQILSFFALFWVLEDFLWFVRNPHFGLANFKPDKIWWHSVWWGSAPRDYYVGTVIGVALYAISLM
jgi:hypothetical protein